MALVRKILEKTLTAGSTSISFTDSDIPNSLLRVYSSQASLFPISQTLSGNVLTITYKAQANNVGIALEIVKQGLDIVDNVTSTDTDKALSANQGYVLKGLIDSIVIPTVPENITDLDDVSVTSIQNGQVLAWNSTSEKFENVNQSGGSSEVYTTDEQLIGTYLGENLYRKVIPITQNWDFVANTWVKSNIPQGNMKSIINGRLQITYNNTYSLHFIQLGFIDNYVAGNCFRSIATVAGGANLILEYTKTS